MPVKGPYQSFDIPVSCDFIAELISLPFAMPSGAPIWVEQTKSFWVLQFGATANGVDVLASTFPNAFWANTGTMGTSLLTGVTTYYINGATGNNLNSGTVSSAPLHDAQTAVSRIGFNTTINSEVHIVFQTDMAANDYLAFQWRMGPNSWVDITGTPKASVLNGTFTAGTAGVNRTVAPSPTIIVDAAVPDFTPFVGKRVRITASATPSHVGCCAFIQNFIPAAHQAATTPFWSSYPPVGSTSPTQVVPSVGDSYVLEDVPNVNLGLASFQGTAPFFNFTTTLPRFTSGSLKYTGLFGEIGSAFVVNGTLGYIAQSILTACVIQGPGGGGATLQLIGCLTLNLNMCGGAAFVFGGGSTAAGGIYDSANSGIFIGGDFYGEGARCLDVTYSAVFVEEFGGFGCPDDSIYIRNAASLLNSNSILGNTPAIYGNRNVVGIGIRPGGQLIYTPGQIPTIQGSAAPFSIGGTPKTSAGIPFINAANNAMMVAQTS